MLAETKQGLIGCCMGNSAGVIYFRDRSSTAIRKAVEQIPASCADAACELDKDRDVHLLHGVFSDDAIEYQKACLKNL